MLYPCQWHVYIRQTVFLLQGSHIITALRPVEHLESLLSTGLGADSDLVAGYFQQYGVRILTLIF